ncbi:MFS transporter [Peribacillus muralis]|uniref:MFS transporter n=1 Tax=Peribacillus muralis TaxID=264697 RepID=UPI000708B7E5|nr:MFS transporter [Peribacillus muralis]
MSGVSQERKELLKNRAYFLYFIATTFSFFGNGMQFISSSWLGLTMTQSNYTIAIILICSSIPGIILSPFSGVWVDRLNKRILAGFLDFFRALVLLIIPIIWWMGDLNIWHIYLMTFLVAAGDVLFQPTIVTLIREIIPRTLLLTANSTTQITAQIGSVVGAGIGGIIVALYEPVWVMLINGLTFFVSGICILLMPKATNLTKQKQGMEVKNTKFFEQFIAELKVGYRYILHNRQIWILYVIMLSYPISLRTINSLLPIFSKDVLKVGAAGFGYIDAGFALGAIVGGFFLPSIVKRLGNWFTLVGGVGVLGCSILFFSLSFNLFTGILGYFLVGCTFQTRIAYLTTIQYQVNIEVQGRVHSFYTTFVSLFALLVYIMLGIMSELVSSRLLFASLGIIILIATMAAMYFIPKKSVNQSYSA